MKRNYEQELRKSTRIISEKTDWWGYVMVVTVGLFLAYLIGHFIVGFSIVV